MNVQFIDKDGVREWAILPYEDYLSLVSQQEMEEDVRAYDEAMQLVAEGEELIPASIVYALADGENPLKVWREYRRMSQHLLAEMTGMSASYLSQIESGKRRGSAETLSKLASALNLTIDDLIT